MGRLAGFLGTLAGLVILVILLLTSINAVEQARHERRMDSEARQIGERPFVRDPDRPGIVITGSSTVRLWRSSAAAFPGAQVVNTGFGGSTMNELADHYQELIGRYQPDEVFIGSGDNDLAFGRSRDEILSDAKRLVERIQQDLPGARIAFIAAKPSLERWYLHQQYAELNEGLRALADAGGNVVFVDVWNRLLDRDGQVRPELYGPDGLHLNRRGYQIYAAALAAA